MDGKEVKGDLDKYKLQKFTRSNQNTCINQRPIVAKGMRVKVGDILAMGRRRTTANWRSAATCWSPS